MDKTYETFKPKDMQNCELPFCLQNIVALLNEKRRKISSEEIVEKNWFLVV